MSLKVNVLELTGWAGPRFPGLDPVLLASRDTIAPQELQ
jgi:hypothetical protein